MEARAVVVDTPGATNLQRVPREDFAAVWAHRDDYCAGELPRHRLRDMTRFSKYVISILHHVWKAMDRTRQIRAAEHDRPGSTGLPDSGVSETGGVQARVGNDQRERPVTD